MGNANDDVIIAYAAGDLQRGATEQAKAADAADGLARMLAGLQFDPTVLGTVRSAVPFAQAVDTAQRTQAGSAAGEARRRTTLGRRTDVTADLGNGLTTASAQVAQSGGLIGPPR